MSTVFLGVVLLALLAVMYFGIRSIISLLRGQEWKSHAKMTGITFFIAIAAFIASAMTQTPEEHAKNIAIIEAQKEKNTSAPQSPVEPEKPIVQQEKHESVKSKADRPSDPKALHTAMQKTLASYPVMELEQPLQPSPPFEIYYKLDAASAITAKDEALVTVNALQDAGLLDDADLVSVTVYSREDGKTGTKRRTAVGILMRSDSGFTWAHDGKLERF